MVTTSTTPAGRRILAAAEELFYARGIHAVGVEAIATAAGVTKKTIYDRFGSKEALIAAYLGERGERWRRWLAGYLDRAAPDERLLAPFDALEAWMPDQPRRGCAFVNAHAELPSIGEHARELATGQKTLMLDLFIRLARDAGAAHAEQLASQLFMLHEGATISHAIAGDDRAVATARDAARALIAAGTAGPEPADSGSVREPNRPERAWG